MVKTSLIYFDTVVNSGKYGTLRGLCAFIIIIPFFLPLWCVFKSKLKHKIWSTILLALALCSAIGVQLPGSYWDSALYAGLIGAVISVGFICIRTMVDDYKEDPKDNDHMLWTIVPYLCLCLICAALFTRYMSLKFDLYHS